MDVACDHVMSDIQLMMDADERRIAIQKVAMAEAVAIAIGCTFGKNKLSTYAQQVIK